MLMLYEVSLSVVWWRFYLFFTVSLLGKFNNIGNLDIRYALRNIPFDRMEQICCGGILLLVL